MKSSRLVLRILATLIFLSGLSMLHPRARIEAKALFTLYAPRTDTPMEGDTWRFEKEEDPDLGTYYLYRPAMPDDVPEDKRWPLVVVLHGGPGKAYAARYLTEDGVQKDYSSFVLAPVLPWNRTWGVPGGEPPRIALHDLVALIRKLESEYPIDPQRLYIMGCSDGGIGTFAAVAWYPDLFAAAMPISGMWTTRDAGKMVNTPMWIVNGAHDTVIPPEPGREIAQEIKLYGGDVTYTEHGDMGHYCPSSGYYTDAAWRWMFSKIREK